MPSSGSKRRKRDAETFPPIEPEPVPEFAMERLHQYTPDELQGWYELFRHRRDSFTAFMDSVASELLRRLCEEE
jgi:hypothetical protein